MLHQAAGAGDAGACRALLAAGAATAQRDNHGRSAADHARSAGHFALAAALEGRRETAEDIAAHQPLALSELVGLVSDKRSTIDQLIANRRLNARDIKGDTPLHIVARRGKMQIADILLGAGADLYATNLEGRIPADLAADNGHTIMAALLYVATGSRPGTEEVVSPPNSATVTADSLSAIVPDLDLLDTLEFDAELEPEDFHLRSGHTETTSAFERVADNLQIATGDDDAVIEWGPPVLRGAVIGDGIAETGRPAPRDEGESALHGRQRLRRMARPSPWRQFHIEAAGCAEIVARVIAQGYVTDDDTDDLLGQCRGRFDADALRINIAREFEAAGLLHPQAAETEPRGCPPDIDAQDLTEALIATCSRDAPLPGASRPVPGVATALALTSTLADLRRTMLAGLVESSMAIDIILYMTERVISGEIEAREITAHDYSPAHPTPEGQRFTRSVAALQIARDGVVAGSGRAIRNAISAVEALDLRVDFLRDVASAMAEAPELRELATRLAGNLAAIDAGADALRLAFLPLCRRYAAQQATDDEDQEDLFQAGFFGLHRAVIRFRPEPGRHFITYTSMWLRQSVNRWRQDESGVVRVPHHQLGAFASWDLAREQLTERFGRTPGLDDMRAELGYSLPVALTLSRALRERVDLETLDDTADADSGHGIPEVIRLADIRRLITEELNQLDDRHADIIRRRYGIGFDDEMTLEEVGQLYGVTRERIRQLEAKGFQRLTRPARMRYLAQAL